MLSRLGSYPLTQQQLQMLHYAVERQCDKAHQVRKADDKTGERAGVGPANLPEWEKLLTMVKQEEERHSELRK